MPSLRRGSRRVPAPTRPGGPGAGVTSGRGTGPTPGPDVGAASGPAAWAGAGRHRRPRPPSRPILLTVLAVLALLLGSGTAIALTAAPVPIRPDTPDVAAIGAAPAAGAPTLAGTPSLSPTPSPTPEPDSPPEPEPANDPEPEPEPEPADDPGARVDEITAMEDEVTALTNAERTAAGCDGVRTDERLRTAARGHSQDMAANDYFDHTGLDGRSPFDRMADAGYPDPAGENIAYGYRTPADVMAGWMDSDGHRDNLLSCSHQAIGVGLAYDGDGRPYWTQNFGR